MPTLRQIRAQRPNRIQFETITFHHSTFGYVRLVNNQIFAKRLAGIDFDACRFELTESQQSSIPVIDSTLKFSRLAQDFKQKLKAWKGYSRVTPISATFALYDADMATLLKSWVLYVNDCSMDALDVNVSLSMTNPLNKNIGILYDPAEWPGLAST
ncbi:hypothetical protein [Erwinia sp. Leaf53]|uniref:hypothetical protein n=1 Tax=Erwinia sp. Leaf53 TaxID=1736225 RepID=UPI0006F470A4|nr:hypothetical protein [Erwinia sp. Leaf53]KQN53216.1 hypothetical protein ASF13_16600 [Erwinia sp. Leaf53]